MTNFLFIRHAAHDYLRRAIAGRIPGVHLNELGRQQAEQLAQKLSLLPIDAIFSSPLERTRETAEPIARQLNLPVQIAEEFTEINFGDWTDRPFSELNSVSEWRHFNAFRSSTAPPRGELMLEVQTRVVRKLSSLRGQYSFVAIVSHGDAIRATMAHFLGQPLDLVQRIEIDPASLSIVECGDDYVRVRLLNAPSTGSPLELPKVRHQ
ncbi:MAG: histidine phosphatase family protein [Chthoniobacterales bacterium]